ncbi:MAG: ABC transporter permease [Planctomycetes bacterium]|nr:ABC transporter permease [Planctomycetota bacterium]
MNTWRTLTCSAWLGWQIESNWAAPWLFALYVLVKPLAGSLLLVCMYLAARATAVGGVPPSFLPFLYVSSACFMVIGGMTFGMSQAVVTDRESYYMLKFIRMSPARLRTYLIGRGLSRAGQAALGASLTVGVGLLLFPELRAALIGRTIAWGWLLFYGLVGIVMMVALGLILAGAVLNMARYGMFLAEGVAGVLYLFSGAVFPLDVLPFWLRPISLALPPTYWLEGMRRSLLGPLELHSTLSTWGQGQLALALVASTLALVLTAHLFFRWSEQRAWRLGRYDETSN